MRFEETRDNTTAIETVMMAADSAEEILVALGHSPEAAEQMANPSEPDPAGVQLERRFGELPEVARKRIAREHDKIVAEARRESEERNGCDDEPEDDGQPSEYEEWQDYFGGDEYYDHSENECW